MKDKKFDFNRFGKLFVSDLKNAYAQFGNTLLILVIAAHVSWITGLVFHFGDALNECYPTARCIVACTVCTLAVYMAPSRIYKNVNIPGKGNYFAMLPASLPEKFVSMLIMCIVVVPVIYMLSFFVLDVLLTALPFGPYKEFIWKTELDVIIDRVTDFAAVTPRMLVQSLLSAVGGASLFVMTNTIFKTHKFSKTIMWIIIISFALSLVSVPIAQIVGYDIIEWMQDIMSSYSEEKIVNAVMWISMIVSAVVDFVLLFVTYRRLKRMQY